MPKFKEYTKEEAKKGIQELVELFRKNEEEYLNPNYSEHQVREDFINKFFRFLNWDITNEKKATQLNRDVIGEDSLKIQGNTKSPDYAFKIGDSRKFYVEAKKPCTPLNTAKQPAYQVRLYGYNKKLPISILTDFEEFAIYDTKIPPKAGDSPQIARYFYCRYMNRNGSNEKTYEENFDEIWSWCSRDAMFDSESNYNKVFVAKTKKGQQSVDDNFLAYLKEHRLNLAKEIANRNKEETFEEYHFNYIVQKILDRIIFLRIAEDRSFEPLEQLKKIANDSECYSKLCEIFIRGEDKYNSTLFAKEDRFLHELKINDKPLKDFIKGLYYPNPYHFGIMPIEILGHIYEQFLGDVIRVLPKGGIKVEQKPEVRKAGGVYYTPQYIVDYIVENTVGEKLKGKTDEEASTLSVVDPACGSGSFLIGAYAYILNWHLEYYTKTKKAIGDAIKKGYIIERSYENGNGENMPRYALAIEKKKEILLNNIYGVDIDAQAVEVTKLSLHLKMLENENAETGGTFFDKVGMTLLPDLSIKNIKCGNSLIGDDFYDDNNDLFSDRTLRRKINTFDWKSEFKEVFDKGGFDCVIGNPPWVSLKGKFGNDIMSGKQQAYLIEKFNGNTYRPNIFEYFVSVSLNIINRRGISSLIVPDRLGFNEQFENIRRKIITQHILKKLIYKAPFPFVIVDTLIFVISNKKNKYSKYNIDIGEWDGNLQIKDSDSILLNEKSRFLYEESDSASWILDKIYGIEGKQILSDISCTNTGVILDSNYITENRESNNQIEIAKGKSISRYGQNARYFCEFSHKTIKGGTNDTKKLGVKNKILLRKTGYPIFATLDSSGVFPEQSLYFLFNINDKYEIKYILGVINSCVFMFCYKNRMITNKNTTPQLKKVNLDEFPIVIASKKKQTIISHLVDQMLQAQKELHEAKNPIDKKNAEKTVELLDKQIDSLVYELYGLTSEEIEIVEKSVSG